jgi:SnoaL-like domain
LDLITRLAAIDEIKQIKGKYFRCLDAKDWDGLISVWAPEVELDMTHVGRSGGRAMSNHGALTYMQGRIGNTAWMVHHGHTPEIEFTSDTTATGIWQFEDWLRWEDGNTSPDGYTDVHGWGYYDDRYLLTEDGWRISYTSVTRTRAETK